MQKRHNSIAKALELCRSCTYPSICDFVDSTVYVNSMAPLCAMVSGTISNQIKAQQSISAYFWRSTAWPSHNISLSHGACFTKGHLILIQIWRKNPFAINKIEKNDPNKDFVYVIPLVMIQLYKNLKQSYIVIKKGFYFFGILVFALWTHMWACFLGHMSPRIYMD